MDRGIPTEATLASMRASDPPVHYLVGTPKGRLTRLKKLWRRPHELRGQSLKRDELLLKLGAAKQEAGRAWPLVEIRLPKVGEAVTPETFSFALRRDRLRRQRCREGRYLLRSNLTGEDPATLWRYYHATRGGRAGVQGT